MLHKLKLFFIHPLVLLAVIAYLECIPYKSELGKIVVHDPPKVGDNFQIAGDLAVYYYNGIGKYSYGTSECYFSFGNPSWSTAYKDGGIKTVDAQTANAIPLLGNMCDSTTKINFKKRIPSKKFNFSTNVLLENFSNISHVACFFLFTMSLLYYFRNHSKKYWIAFAVSFLAGGALEFVQKYFVEGRSASIDDQLRNTFGAVLALAFYAFIYKLKAKRTETVD
ncbi:MAG: VanZ family protein [Flavobacterium sp.]|nr:VanZ family protein [Flavobacterium sp.]